MNFKKSVFFTFLALMLFATSCKKKSGNTISLNLGKSSIDVAGNPAINMIPESSSAVSAINLKRLMDKADFPAIQKMEFYQDMIEEVSSNDPGILAVLQDPNASGLDLGGHAFWVQDMDIMDPNNAANVFVIPLKNKSAFEALVAGGGTPQSGQGFQYIKPERNVAVSWNDEVAVFAMSSGWRSDVMSSVNKFFSTKKSNSISNDKDLKKCFSKEADMVSWFNSNSVAEAAKGQMGMALAMAGFSPDMFEDNFSHSYLNFENGEIVAQSQYWINEKLSKDLKHMFKDEVNTNFGKYLAEDNLLFAFSGALDMKGIKDISDAKNGTFLADSALKEYGLSMAGLAKTFDGDFLVSGYSVPGKNEPSMFLATKINSKKNFQKILDLGIEYGVLSDEGSGVYGMKEAGSNDGFGAVPQLYFDGDMVFIGDGNGAIGGIKSGDWGKNGVVGTEVKNIVSNNLMGFFMDFQKLAGMMDMGDEFDFSALNDIKMTMGREDAGFKLDMKDKSINSLKSLFIWINDNYKKNNNRSM